MATIRLDETVARKVLTTVDAGLCKGVGQAEPGHMCVEAAVCFALDLPHGDNPLCVGSAVREAKIQLNDFNWSSDMARARGMRKLSLAQLGSESINQVEFVKRLTFLVITKMLPKTLRLAKLEKEAKACEEALDSAASSAASASSAAFAASASSAADDAASAAASAAAYAAAKAAFAADAAVFAAVFAAYAAASAAAYAAAKAAFAADAAASAAAYAAAKAAFAADAAAYAAFAAAKAAYDLVLTEFADLMLQVLVEMKSPGCEWLYLTELAA